jgi:ATP-dependent Clp protease adapter protein ClpS
VNDQQHVVTSLFQLTPLKWNTARQRMLEAHNTGSAYLLSTHKEHAELIQQQLIGQHLLVTIEPEKN